MSFHSHSNTPSVVPSPVATSPKYSLSGIANEINRSKSKNGYLSTFFGRSKYGTADRTTNVYRPSEPVSTRTLSGTINSSHTASINQLRTAGGLTKRLI